MPIHVRCSCGKLLKVNDKLAGTRGRCPACGQVLDVPLLKDPPRSEPSAQRAGMATDVLRMEVRPEIAGSGAATEGVDFHTRSRRARWFSLIATILIVLTFPAGVFLV